jgi:hypothetical protein
MRIARPEWVTDEPSWLNDWQAVVTQAQALLEGRVGVIVCARHMTRLAFQLREEHDPNFIVFRGIDSESDCLPAGAERGNWSSTALVEEDRKISVAENQWREVAKNAASKLIAKYEGKA